MKKYISILLSLLITITATSQEDKNYQQFFHDVLYKKYNDFRFPETSKEINNLLTTEKDIDSSYNFERKNINDLINQIKINTEKYLLDYPDEISLFENYDIDLLKSMFENDFKDYLSNDESWSNLNELVIVFSEMENAKGRHTKAYNLTKLNISYLDQEPKNYMSVLHHETVHALQGDDTNSSLFPQFLTEASASSHYEYQTGKVFKSYDEQRISERLIMLLGITSENKIEEYYQAILNNDYYAFSKFINYKEENADDILNLFIQLELYYMTYENNNMYELSKETDIETRRQIAGYDSLIWLYKTLTDNLIKSSYSLDDKLLIYQYINTNMYELTYNLNDDDFFKEISSIQQSYINTLKLNYNLVDEDISNTFDNNTDILKEIILYTVTKNVVKYESGYKKYCEFDFFKLFFNYYPILENEEYIKQYTLH